MGRGSKRSIIVLDKQLTGRRHRTKGIIVRREEIKVESELRSADAVCLSGEVEIVYVVFRRRGRFERELVVVFLEGLGLSSSDHCSARGE